MVVPSCLPSSDFKMKCYSRFRRIGSRSKSLHFLYCRKVINKCYFLLIVHFRDNFWVQLNLNVRRVALLSVAGALSPRRHWSSRDGSGFGSVRLRINLPSAAFPVRWRHNNFFLPKLKKSRDRFSSSNALVLCTCVSSGVSLA